MRAGGDAQRGWEELRPREGQDSISRETRERVEEDDIEQNSLAEKWPAKRTNRRGIVSRSRVKLDWD
jgi:hypothetical protein